MDDTRAAEIRRQLDKDTLVDTIADAFNAHPMLLGYNESDRMLIAGALAIAAVNALPLPDLAYLLAEREQLLAVVEAAEQWIEAFSSAERARKKMACVNAVRAYRATTGEAGR